MNKADVAAPALVTGNLARFPGPGRRFPEHLKIHVEITEIAERLSELAGPNSAIEVDHGRRLTRGTGHRPSRGSVQVLELRAVMERQSADVNGFLDPLHKAIR